MTIRLLALALLVAAFGTVSAEAQVRVRIRAAAPVIAVAPGMTLAGRTVASAPGDPACLVTRGNDWTARAEMQMLVPRTRVGEHWAAITPAFGRCTRPQNPFRARLVVFNRITSLGPRAVLRRGSLSCVMQPGNVGDMLVCNRPLRCDVTKHRCVNP
jgi:hypothetical protein